jgi:transglutaminase-like putative cysteine protease
MRRIVKDWRVRPEMRSLAESIIGGLAEKDFSGEIEALHAWVRDSIRYVNDINEVETLKTPDLVLSTGQGDCDDKAILLATLLESAGHPARFVAVGFEPDNFSHVYVESKIGPRWLPLETTEQVSAGWSPEGVITRMVRHI